jgi:GntR family transcriptional regulator
MNKKLLTISLCAVILITIAITVNLIQVSDKPTNNQNLSHADWKDHYNNITDLTKAADLIIKGKKVDSYNEQRVDMIFTKEVIEIKRLRLVDDKPLALEISYIPYNLCEGLEKYDFEILSLHEVLSQNYGINLVRSIDEIYITYTTEEESEILEVEPGAAVLILKEVSFNPNNEPIEYSKAITIGERCRFRSILK